MLGRRHDDRIGPALLDDSRTAGLDRGVLRGPERIGIGEIAVLAEQVGDGRKAARLDVEQRVANRDRLSAEQPCLKLVARSEERRVGKEGVSTGRSWWRPEQ